jgi:hypothetical protein
VPCISAAAVVSSRAAMGMLGIGAISHTGSWPGRGLVGGTRTRRWRQLCWPRDHEDMPAGRDVVQLSGICSM